jgi:hypothetical protein
LSRGSRPGGELGRLRSRSSWLFNLLGLLSCLKLSGGNELRKVLIVVIITKDIKRVRGCHFSL